jgi:hypothetical protein
MAVWQTAKQTPVETAARKKLICLHSWRDLLEMERRTACVIYGQN